MVEKVPAEALGRVVEAAALVVLHGIADAMFAARHAATKDSRPIGNAAAWRKFLDEPTAELLAALDACEAGTAARLEAVAREAHDQEERLLAQPAAAGALG